MFQDLLRQLTGSAPAPLSPIDERRALSALLVRLARSDGDYAASEIASIDAILTRRYGLSPQDAQALRAEGEALEAEAPDTVRFTNAIKAAVAIESRASIVEALWEVALADGIRDEAEDAMLRMVTRFFGLTDVESARARQRAGARV